MPNMTIGTLKGWHKLLGHFNTTGVIYMNTHGVVRGMRVIYKIYLLGAMYAQAKQSDANTSTRTTRDEVGEVLCIDLKLC